MSERISFNAFFMGVAKLSSHRSTCIRRQVGAVLVSKDNRIISTGYNGVPEGVTHCIDVPCKGANGKSGTSLDKCGALHAEVNAIARCHRLDEGYKIYTTTSPCMSCTKLIVASKIMEVYYLEEYPNIKEVKEFLNASGVSINII